MSGVIAFLPSRPFVFAVTARIMTSLKYLGMVAIAALIVMEAVRLKKAGRK